MCTNSSGIKHAHNSRISLFLHFHASAGHSRKWPKAAKSLTCDRPFRDRMQCTQCKKYFYSQLWKQLSLLNVAIINTGMFDMPYSRCRDKPDDKSSVSGGWEKFYHEWDVAKIALARSKGPSIDWWSGFIWSDWMLELWIKKKSAMWGG